MLLTLQLKLEIKKGHTPSITTVTITVYLKENGNKKKCLHAECYVFIGMPSVVMLSVDGAECRGASFECPQR